MIDDHSMFPVPGDRVTWVDNGTFTGYVESVWGNDLLVSSSQEGGAVRFRFVSIIKVVKVDKPSVPTPDRTVEKAAQKLWEVLAGVDHGSWHQDVEWIRQAFAARDYWLSCFPDAVVTYGKKPSPDDFVSFGEPGQCIRYPRGGEGK
jgi:hypothetical protein